METPEGWGICVKEAEELEVVVILVAGNPGDERNVLSSFGLGVVLRYRQEDDVHEVQLWGPLSRNNRAFLRREKMQQEESTDRVPISADENDESTGIGSFSENETAEENELLNRLLHKEVSTGLTPTSAVRGPNLCNSTMLMSRQGTHIHGQWWRQQLADAFISALITLQLHIFIFFGGLPSLEESDRAQQSEGAEAKSEKVSAKLF